MLLALTAPLTLPLLGAGFDADTLALSQILFYLMLPSILFNGLAMIWSSVLNAGEHFALAAIAPAAVPVVTSIFLVIMAQQWGVYALVAGLVFGFIVQVLILGLGLKQQGIRLRPGWSGRTPALRQVERQYLPMLAGAFLMGGTTLVDQSMATVLGPGSVATLNYGSKLVALALNIGAMSIGTVVLPYFSGLVANDDWRTVRRTLKRYAALILLTTIPFTLCLVALSEPLVRLVFQRGAFTAIDTQNVSQVQSFYFLQIPFYMVGIFMVRLISALKANHLLMWGSLISLAANIVLNYLFIQVLGVSGIALSTAGVYVIACLYMSFMLFRLLRSRPEAISIPANTDN
jgi:putative peptidoglycan lipid II flippase